jgi:hypothetical protein
LKNVIETFKQPGVANAALKLYSQIWFSKVEAGVMPKKNKE